MGDSDDAVEQLPRAVVARLAKAQLPPHVKLPKDVEEAVLRASTVFILFLTDQALAVAASAGRSTLTADDVVQALSVAELDEFAPELSALKQGPRVFAWSGALCG
eukprot:TRINITY_DN5293_c0_g1_i1.p1 TRINITY_DN5293_c0_g1~~TRINITY_DN5293_c0_g1_i1.p1  ORF type:complete len:112 (+),score=36.01 TRINITY_DN5293_c0_g1_i1:24-338(+)